MTFKNIYHLQRQEISCMKNPNWLPEGIKGTLLPGRAIIARAEGEMTRLDIFSGSIMLPVMEWMEILIGIIGILGFWMKCTQVTNSK